MNNRRLTSYHTWSAACTRRPQEAITQFWDWPDIFCEAWLCTCVIVFVHTHLNFWRVCPERLPCVMLAFIVEGIHLILIKKTKQKKKTTKKNLHIEQVWAVREAVLQFNSLHHYTLSGCGNDYRFWTETGHTKVTVKYFSCLIQHTILRHMLSAFFFLLAHHEVTSPSHEE